MAYMALYRKWRPMVFDEVKGQDPIVKTLKNQILSGRVGHAYLFCGTRGTGKTTVAKIMARAVNCENPVDGSPCNSCPSCRAILSGASMNVAEIDAASNNGVEDIRGIREQVQYAPTEGRYRVYIIDEVHMLSVNAFNALLKTLEEPPSYVIFILATTEANRIPITVLSRCQRYDFRHIGSQTLTEQLMHILREEKVGADEAAVRYIARAADGSMRDALSLLEQCVSFYFGEHLTYESVLDVLGAVDTEVFSRFLRLILACDLSGCVALLDEITAQGRDMTQFVTDFIWYMRNLMMLQTTGRDAESLDMSGEGYERLKEEAASVDLTRLMRYIRIASELANSLRYAVAKRVLVELACIRMMQPAMEDDTQSLSVRIGELEEALAGGSFIRAADSPDAPGDGAAEEQDAPVVELSEAEYADYEELSRGWRTAVNKLRYPLKSFLQGTRISFERGKGPCVLFTNPFNYSMMTQRTDGGDEMSDAPARTRMHDLTAALAGVYEKEYRLEAKLLTAGEAAPRIKRGSRIAGIEMDIEDAD